MPPLFRVDVGKEVHYCLDEAERDLLLDRIEAEKKTGKVTVTRFKGLGEMNPSQLRETTMAKETRRLVQLTIDGKTMDDGRRRCSTCCSRRSARPTGATGSRTRATSPTSESIPRLDPARAARPRVTNAR